MQSRHLHCLTPFHRNVVVDAPIDDLGVTDKIERSGGRLFGPFAALSRTALALARRRLQRSAWTGGIAFAAHGFAHSWRVDTIDRNGDAQETAANPNNACRDSTMRSTWKVGTGADSAELLRFFCQYRFVLAWNG
jgi:hypothetical protein